MTSRVSKGSKGRPTTSARRVGAETSATRDHLLDCIERLIAETGYASVTYRAVATAADVTSGLVQYYFPTQDDLFLAVIRRRSGENVDRLRAALDARGDEPLRVLWEFSRDESNSALTTEFLALGNHRQSVRTEIAEVTEQVRQLQLEVLRAHFGKGGVELGPLSPEALLFLLTGIPRLVRLEEGVGVSTTHPEAMAAFEDFLDRTEPRRKKTRRSR